MHWIESHKPEIDSSRLLEPSYLCGPQWELGLEASRPNHPCRKELREHRTWKKTRPHVLFTAFNFLLKSTSLVSPGTASSVGVILSGCAAGYGWNGAALSALETAWGSKGVPRVLSVSSLLRSGMRWRGTESDNVVAPGTSHSSPGIPVLWCTFPAASGRRAEQADHPLWTQLTPMCQSVNPGQLQGQGTAHLMCSDSLLERLGNYLLASNIFIKNAFKLWSSTK